MCEAQEVAEMVPIYSLAARPRHLNPLPGSDMDFSAQVAERPRMLVILDVSNDIAPLASCVKRRCRQLSFCFPLTLHRLLHDVGRPSSS